MIKTGILLCGHGSKETTYSSCFKMLEFQVRSKLPGTMVARGYLEFEHPGYEKAIDKMVARGIERILVIPVFLFSGRHVSEDLPGIFSGIELKYQEVEFVYGKHLAEEIDLGQYYSSQVKKMITNEKNVRVVLVSVGSKYGNNYREGKAIVKRLGSDFPNLVFDLAYINKNASPYVAEVFKSVRQDQGKEIIVVPMLLYPGKYLEFIDRELTALGLKNARVEPTIGNHPVIINGIIDQIKKLTGKEAVKV